MKRNDDDAAEFFRAAADLAEFRRREGQRASRNRVVDVDDYHVDDRADLLTFDTQQPTRRPSDPRPIIDRDALRDYRARVGNAGREGWRELRRVLFWLALAAVIIAALAAFNGRDDDAARSTFSPVALDARDLTTDALDVDRYGIVRADGEVRGSVWDKSGVEIRDEYLAGLRAGEPIVGDDSALVEDGLKFCALMASGDREALLTAADAGIAARPYGSTPRSVKLAASALVHFCPRFDQ